MTLNAQQPANRSELFHGRRHFCNRHEGLCDLVQELPGILLFAERHGEEMNNRGLTKLECKVPRGGVRSNLVMLHALRCADEGKICRRIILVFSFGHHLFAFVDKACHAFAGLGCGRRTKDFQALAKTLNLRFSLFKMGFDQSPQLR